MKKLAFIFVFLFSQVSAENSINSEHIKIALGGFLTLGGAVASGYYLYKAYKLNEILRQRGYLDEVELASRNNCLLAGIGFGALALASGIYSGYKIYNKTYKISSISDFEKKRQQFLGKTDKTNQKTFEAFKNGSMSVIGLCDDIDKTKLSFFEKIKIKKEILNNWKSGNLSTWNILRRGNLENKQQDVDFMITSLTNLIKEYESTYQEQLKKEQEEESKRLAAEKKHEALEKYKNYDHKFLEDKCSSDDNKEIQKFNMIKKLLKDSKINDSDKIGKIAGFLNWTNLGEPEKARVRRILNWYNEKIKRMIATKEG